MVWMVMAALAVGLHGGAVNAPGAWDAYAEGVRALDREDFRAAEEAFTRSVELAPRLYPSHYGLGQAHMARRRYAEAAEAYARCRDVMERLAALESRASAVADVQAVAEFRALHDAVSRTRDTPGLGALALLQQRLEALRQRQRGRQVTVHVPGEVLLALGSALFRAGDLPAAEREYRAAVAAGEPTGAAHNNLAVILLKRGRLAEAEDELRRAEQQGFPVSAQFKQDLRGR